MIYIIVYIALYISNALIYQKTKYALTYSASVSVEHTYTHILEACPHIQTESYFSYFITSFWSHTNNMETFGALRHSATILVLFLTYPII